MDDRELEARLGTHLHRRFDDAPVPAGLGAAVRQGLDSAPTSRVGFSLGHRGLQLGWVATAAIAVVFGAFLILGSRLGPANPGATRTPSTTPVPTLQVITERWFVVLPPNGTTPTATDRAAAAQILMDRLAPWGLKSTSSEAPGVITLTLERDGLPDEAIRRILAATGVVEFVPLPPEFYGEGVMTAIVGEPLPHKEPALFGWEGIESVAHGTDQQDRPTLNFRLTAEARQAFGEYTTKHSQESLAIVIDGVVAVVPVINEPITGGEVAISGGFLPGSPEAARFDETAAVLVGGRLPDSWRGAEVVGILDHDAAIDAARASGHSGGGDVAGVSLDALLDGSRWSPVWRVSFAGGVVLTLDAVTGAWLSTLTP